MTHFIRTLSNQPALPVPAGAVAGDWDQLTDAPDDLLRFLTWSRHDAAGVVVAVEGTQYGDGRVDRYIALRPDSFRDEFTAVEGPRAGHRLARRHRGS